MVNGRKSSSKARATAGRVIAAAEVVVALGVLTLGACSSATPAPPSAAMKRVELSFNLGTCQQIDVNIYKCPAVDKPICNPDYNGSLECVRIGRKGSVYVESESE